MTAKVLRIPEGLLKMKGVDPGQTGADLPEPQKEEYIRESVRTVPDDGLLPVLL